MHKGDSPMVWPARLSSLDGGRCFSFLWERVSGRRHHQAMQVTLDLVFLVTGFGGGGVVGCLPPPHFVTRPDQSNWFLTVYFCIGQSA